MSDETQEKRKHRHDGPDVGHGTVSQERTMVAIQFILGTCLVLTAAVVVFTLVSA